MLKIVLSRTTVGNPLERLLAFQFPVCTYRVTTTRVVVVLLFNVDRKLVSTFKRKSRQNAPIVKTLARMRPHDTR